MANRTLTKEEKTERRKELLQKIANRCWRDAKKASQERNYQNLERILNCLRIITRHPERPLLVDMLSEKK